MIKKNPKANRHICTYRCANAAAIYKSATIYALQTLNMCNVWLYLDAGHAGWLGWPANLTREFKMIAHLHFLLSLAYGTQPRLSCLLKSTLQACPIVSVVLPPVGPHSLVWPCRAILRRFALDVANYNALSAATPDPVTSPNPNTDELKYINALAPALVAQGFPAA